MDWFLRKGRGVIYPLKRVILQFRGGKGTQYEGPRGKHVKRKKGWKCFQNIKFMCVGFKFGAAWIMGIKIQPG